MSSRFKAFNKLNKRVFKTNSPSTLVVTKEGKVKAKKVEQVKMKTSAARAVYAVKYIEDGETKEAEVQFSTLEDTLTSYMARVHPQAELISRVLV